MVQAGYNQDYGIAEGDEREGRESHNNIIKRSTPSISNG
jgi:hypothetical protein